MADTATKLSANGAAPGTQQPCGSAGPRCWPAVEAASYIAAMTEELADMARRGNLELVAYLLEIAQLEAVRSVERIRSGDR